MAAAAFRSARWASAPEGISGEGYGATVELTARATLRAAIDAGGSFIETADSYREGEMLQWIGDLKRDVGADKVFGR